MLRIGVISDTHGLLRPEAVAYLEGCDHIVHAGDIGSPGILAELSAIAPVTAVRGNNDTGAWAQALPETQLLTLGEARLCMIHELALLDLDLTAARVQVVISGHSHRPKAEWQGGVLYLNPGSAGPRRFSLPVTIAELRVEEGAIVPVIQELQVPMQAIRQARGRP